MTVLELHREAMDRMMQAIVFGQIGCEAEAQEHKQEALILEARAALLIPRDKESEPSRSIMLVSAASLALQCGNVAAARILAWAGLDGYPSPEQSERLVTILEQAGEEEYERHDGGTA